MDKPSSKTPKRATIISNPTKYQENVAFFNADFDEANSSSLQQSAPTKRRNAFSKVLDYLPVEDQNAMSHPSPDNSPAHSPLSKTFSDAQHISDQNRVVERTDLLKSISPLLKAQTLKSNHHQTSANQVFHPADLTRGEVIGRGAFGEVRKITDNVTGKEMVMKKLTFMDPEAEEQFLKEVHLLRSLIHPNVLRFLGVMYEDKVLHIVTEYISGGTLRKLLKNMHIELSWKQRFEIARDISAGMSYLHSQQVIHRDLKSKNILVCSMQGRKRAIVADLGLAGVMRVENNVTEENEDVEEFKQNSSGLPNFKKRFTQVGTCYWMAPEMLKNQAYDETVDIFSFGIVVCEIISRVRADPDELPRRNDFGLDVELFTQKFGNTKPEHFMSLAAACCDMRPNQRPPFRCCEKWLIAMLASLDLGVPLPNIDEVNFCEEPVQSRMNKSSV